MKTTLRSTHLLACALLALSLATAAATDLRVGLVNYWPMETASTTTPDSAFGYAMTLKGTPTIVAGHTANALQFANGQCLKLLQDGSDQNNFPIWTVGEYTIAYWVKATTVDTTTRYHFSMASTASGSGDNTLMYIATASGANIGKLDLYLRSHTGVSYINHVYTATTIDTGWHHIAFVDKRGTVSVYIDGVLDANSALCNYSYVAGSLTPNTTAIGALYRAADTANFIGLMDEVVTFERALSQAEVVQLKNNGIPTPIVSGAAACEMPVTTVKNLGDWQRLTVRFMGKRPLPATFAWSRNNVLDATQTGATYFYPNLTLANNGDAFSVTGTDSFGTASATNTLTVLADPPDALTNGVVNHWPLDTITSDGVNLSSPEVNSGDNMILQGFSGTGDVVLGERGNALWFDTTKYGYRSGGLPISIRTNYSIAMRANIPSGGFNNVSAIFAEASTANGNTLFELAAKEPGITVTIKNDSGSAQLNGTASTTTVVDYNWHYLVWTDANGLGKLYVDGVLGPTDFSYTRGTLTPNTTAIGAELRTAPSSVKLYGNIDDIATWNRALTWTEIQDAMANGVPTPPPPPPPTIITQPSDAPANVYVTDSASFTVLADGANPLSYQWRKNGTAISAAVNSTATNTTLALANLQTTDSGSYTVVITNVSGSITSHVAQLTVHPWALATNGNVANIAFGPAGSALQPGFERGTIQAWTTYSGGVQVTVDGLGSAVGLVQQRDRGPVGINNPPILTQAALYNSFAFLNSTALGADMRIQFARLAPNTKFGVTLWSFDYLSALRFSDWLDTTADVNNPVVLYGNGATYWWPNVPTSDYQNTIRAYMTSTASGTLTIDGVNEGGFFGAAQQGVFLNALQVVANPLPTTSIANLVATTNSSAAAVIHFDVVEAYIGQPAFSLLQTTNLAGGTWVPAQNGTLISTFGPSSTYEFPIQQNQHQLFYRAVTPAGP